MAVSLQKGGSVSLSKEAPGLSDIVVGLGWDPRATDGTEFDLDASVFMLGENEKVLRTSSPPSTCSFPGRHYSTDFARKN